MGDKLIMMDVYCIAKTLCLKYFRAVANDLNYMIFNDSVHRWEKEGAEGWGYQNCLPYFKKAQCHAHGEDQVIFYSLIFLGTF